jgi:hypothetical protein
MTANLTLHLAPSTALKLLCRIITFEAANAECPIARTSVSITCQRNSQPPKCHKPMQFMLVKTGRRKFRCGLMAGFFM